MVEQLRSGRRLNVYRSLWGQYVHDFLPEPVRVRPQLVIVETYRMSSFLGQYGAGRTLKTFSLLPGEKTTISVNTFRKTESDRKVIELFLSQKTVARPIIAPPGVPAERIAILRKAFAGLATDREFLADAEKSNLDVDPIPGEEVDKIIALITSAPRVVVERYTKAFAGSAQSR